MRHDPPLGKTSNDVFTRRGPHSSVPFQIPEDATKDPLAILKVRVDGPRGANRRATRWYAAVSMALIIAPLSMTAKNLTRSP